MSLLWSFVVLVVTVLNIEKCSSQSSFKTLWQNDVDNKEYILLSDDARTNGNYSYWSAKCSEYESTSEPLVFDDWDTEFPMVKAVSASIFYAWVGGSVTNEHHAPVTKDQYFTDDSGDYCVVWDNDQDILSMRCNKVNSIKGIFCERVTGCGDPGTPDNGAKTGNSYKIGDSVSFKCDDGYSLVGASNITCGNDGSWSDEKPTCAEIICGDPGTPENGAKDGDSFGIGDVVSFTCNDDNTPEGAANITCAANGTWSDTLPTCPGGGLETWQVALIAVAVFVVLIVVIGVIVHICRTSGSAGEKGKLLK